jgi:hypothetical protein
LEKQHVQGREGVESEQLFSVTDQEEILEFEPEDMVKNNGHEKKDDQEIIEFAPWNEKTESDPGSGLEEIFEFEPEGGEGE